ncbi:MAG: Phosphopantetheine adenylyltransferase [Candidatus Tokpelaia hoelldobleri]|uniref:Phosphopantetheine adenylyltransferase n=1 Tax=Candidatus Tokpelaia hoelldobleri TaxID=1902579 RepID=A0A1U9JUK7_9HYPH|nr:MAG: Phosphopantetheine adenylyltransferase [Candidatus Tokpelaia hoelldoblerii]
MTQTALYAGSFDPITNGHMDVLKAGLGLAEKIIVAIGAHSSKKPLLSFAEREELIRAVVKAQLPKVAKRIEVIAFDGLLVDTARKAGASIIIRGLRNSTDFDYEMQMADMNAALARDIQTVFVPAGSAVRSITATLVRQIAAIGGDISPFVPALVAQVLERKLRV